MYYKKFRHFGLPQQFQVPSSKFQNIFCDFGRILIQLRITNYELQVFFIFHYFHYQILVGKWSGFSFSFKFQIPSSKILFVIWSDFGRVFIQFQVPNSKFQINFVIWSENGRVFHSIPSSKLISIIWSKNSQILCSVSSFNFQKSWIYREDCINRFKTKFNIIRKFIFSKKIFPISRYNFYFFLDTSIKKILLNINYY